MRLIQVKTVFSETSQVDYSGIRTASFIVGGWLAKVVPSVPDKLSGDERMTFYRTKNFVNSGTEVYSM